MVAPSYHSRVTFTGTSLTLTFMNVTYISGEWELKAANSHVNQELLEIHLQLSRQWRFYTLTIILPIVLLSLTGACGFLLPPQCGEKVSFQVSRLDVNQRVNGEPASTLFPRHPFHNPISVLVVKQSVHYTHDEFIVVVVVVWWWWFVLGFF